MRGLLSPVLGHGLTCCAEEPPYAWADGRAYTTPNQLPEDAWQVPKGAHVSHFPCGDSLVSRMFLFSSNVLNSL